MVMPSFFMLMKLLTIVIVALFFHCIGLVSVTDS